MVMGLVESVDRRFTKDLMLRWMGREAQDRKETIPGVHRETDREHRYWRRDQFSDRDQCIWQDCSDNLGGRCVRHLPAHIPSIS